MKCDSCGDERKQDLLFRNLPHECKGTTNEKTPSLRGTILYGATHRMARNDSRGSGTMDEYTALKFHAETLKEDLVIYLNSLDGYHPKVKLLMDELLAAIGELGHND